MNLVFLIGAEWLKRGDSHPKGIYLEGFTAFAGFNKSDLIFPLMAQRGTEDHFKNRDMMFT